ncbi:MAG: hypothetical protein NW224_00215 [Leptolyngbyaceae cyanobacterium bins.302]|nr:hypothetical protein [Leptolyngbyaceae cyanobacterium bins.302]
MAFELAYTGSLTVTRDIIRLSPLLTTYQVVIESGDFIRVNQELVIPGIGSVFLPESKLISVGKTLLNLDNQYPYRLLVRARDNRTSSQVNVSVWSNPDPKPELGSDPTEPSFEWMNADLGGRWFNFGEPFAAASYTKHQGFVYLRGAVSSTGQTLIFTLPEGFRPAYAMNFIVATFQGSFGVSPGMVTIQQDGSVAYGAYGAGEYFSLDGVSFGV